MHQWETKKSRAVLRCLLCMYIEWWRLTIYVNIKKFIEIQNYQSNWNRWATMKTNGFYVFKQLHIKLFKTWIQKKIFHFYSEKPEQFLLIDFCINGSHNATTVYVNKKKTSNSIKNQNKHRKGVIAWKVSQHFNNVSIFTKSECKWIIYRLKPIDFDLK